MYPNQGQPNPYGGYPNQFPGAPPFGAGYPQQQQPVFGSGYPQMPMPGMQQPGMPMPGMTQPGMPQPGMPGMQQPGMPGMPGMQQPPSMPQQGYPGQQPPPMGQQGYPGGPPQQQPGYQSYPQTSQPNYPQMPQGNFGMPPQTTPMMQQQYSYQNASSYGAPPPQQQMYASPTYGQHQSLSQSKGRPTVVPASNFNASNDAGALRKAMKGFGTDENAIIEVLCRRSNAQRVEIVQTYKTAYGKDLLDDIRSETTGNFEGVLVALLTHSTELYARELYEAMYGEGTDEDVLIEVMCTMSNREIREICMMFQRMFGKSLEQELRSDTSGHFKRLMTSLSTGNRDESMATDVNAARVDASELKRAGIDKWGTDESVFNRILCLRNYEQIKLIAQEYEKLAGHPLEKDIKREFSGDIEDGLLAILRVAQNRPEFFARRLHKSMAGLGTNDKSLIRLVVTRCENDMMDIKEEFQRYYGKTLKSFIKGDTSGDYKHALYALIGENRS